MLTLERFNELRGTHFDATEHNMALIAKLNALNVSEEEVKSYRLPFGSRQHLMRQMATDIAKARGGAPKVAKPAEPKTEPKAPKQEVTKMPDKKITATQPEADALIAALNGVLKAPALNKEEIEAIVDKRVDDRMGNVKPKRIEVVTPTTTKVIEGVTHEKFETVLKLVAAGQAVYLYGPAGTGKTRLAMQVAEALGLKFHYSGQLTQEYQLTGFTDAMGRFQPTPFYNACNEGGMMEFDEMDRSLADVLTKTNAALEQGVFDFPAPIGMVKLHKDFRCIATGNTIGRGATGLYTAANALDASSLDRFIPVEIGYDKRIEDSIDKEAAEFVRVLREAAGLAGLDVVLSYRTIKKLAQFTPMFGAKEVVKMAITAALSKDDINILKRNLGVVDLAAAGNQYAKALA